MEKKFWNSICYLRKLLFQSNKEIWNIYLSFPVNLQIYLFKPDNKLLQQVIGVSRGSDHAPIFQIFITKIKVDYKNKRNWLYTYIYKPNQTVPLMFPNLSKRFIGWLLTRHTLIHNTLLPSKLICSPSVTVETSRSTFCHYQSIPSLKFIQQIHVYFFLSVLNINYIVTK